MKKKLLAIGVLISASTFNANATLTSYTGSDGAGLVYSSVGNITWTKDANLLDTLESKYGYNNMVNAIIAASPTIIDTPNAYDNPTNSGHHTVNSNDYKVSSYADFGPDGTVSWFGAKAFINYLNSIGYGGSNQWRLTSAGTNPQIGSVQTDSELGQLFSKEVGIGTPNSINFPFFTGQHGLGKSSSVSPLFWSSTEWAPNPVRAWNILPYMLREEHGYKGGLGYAWAFSSGQLATVPVPGAVWLMGSALIGLFGLKRRNHAG